MSFKAAFPDGDRPRGRGGSAYGGVSEPGGGSGGSDYGYGRGRGNRGAGRGRGRSYRRGPRGGADRGWPRGRGSRSRSRGRGVVVEAAALLPSPRPRLLLSRLVVLLSGLVATLSRRAAIAS
jgi:hypothetical protein